MISENPNPFLINNFFYLYIMDKDWAEEHGAAIPAAMGAAGEAHANVNANGTGPFRVVRRVPDVETVVEPFDGWWGEKKHNLTQAIFRPISSDPTRVAALLSGELDLIYPVPIQDVSRVDRNDGTFVLSGPENRSVFLIVDLWRDELLYSNIKGKNPFADARVRKAVYQAIDIDAIIRTVMRGQATPALGAALSPTVYGYPHHLERHPFDVDAAKALLADAGYADGFSVTLDCPNDRYVNDEEVCQAIVSMLAKVGIDVTLNAQTKGLHFGKIAKTGGMGHVVRPGRLRPRELRRRIHPQPAAPLPERRRWHLEHRRLLRPGDGQGLRHPGDGGGPGRPRPAAEAGLGPGARGSPLPSAPSPEPRMGRAGRRHRGAAAGQRRHAEPRDREVVEPAGPSRGTGRFAPHPAAGRPAACASGAAASCRARAREEAGREPAES